MEAVHQRGWGSVYAALARGRIDAKQLRDLLARHLPDADPPVFAVDVTTWPRCDAECSPTRGYYYHPSRHSAGQPIIAGWAWQRIVQLSFDRDSWTAPADALRLHPLDDTDQQAASQIRALLARLPAGGVAPWFVFDAGYDSAQLTLDLAHAAAAVLVRLRSDRCFYTDPPPPPPGKTGRPRRHGAKFNCADPTTWPAPTATLACQDDQYGTVTVQAGRGCTQAAPPPQPRRWWAPADRARHHPARAGPAHPRQDPPAQGAVAVVGRPRSARPGPGLAVLHPQVRLRAHRPLCRQTLGWTTPRPRTPEQADRWTWLVLAAYTQLRLARQLACDQRRPWGGSGPDPNRMVELTARGVRMRRCWP